MYQELEIKRNGIALEIIEYKLNVDNFKRVYQFFLQHTIERQKRMKAAFIFVIAFLKLITDLQNIVFAISTI